MRSGARRIVTNNIGAVATANVVSLLCALVQVPLLTHRLEPIEFATITSAIAVGTYASIAQGDALSLALQRFPGEKRSRANYVYARRKLILALAACWVIAIALGLATDNIWLCLAIASWGAGLASMRLTSVAWLMWHQPWRYSTTLAVSTTVRTGILGLLVVQGRDPMLALVLAGCASTAVGFALGPRSSSNDRGTQVSRPWPKGFGIALALGSAGTAVLLNLDRALTPLLITGTEAGSYAAMSTLAMVTVGAALVSLRTVVYPLVVRNWETQPTSAIRRSDQTLIISCLVVIALFLCSGAIEPSWIRFLIPPQLYDPPVASVLVLAYLAYAIGQHGTWWHSLHLRANVIRNRTLIASACMCITLPLLGSEFGGPGIAAAMACSASIYAVLLTWGSPMQLLALASGTIITTHAITISMTEHLAAGLVLAVTLALCTTFGIYAWTVRGPRTTSPIDSSPEEGVR